MSKLLSLGAAFVGLSASAASSGVYMQAENCDVDAPFSGFPCCGERMKWMQLWHKYDGVDSEDPCDWQRHLFKEKVGERPICPDPDYVVPDMLSPENFVSVPTTGDGTYTYNVYRAMNSKDAYASILSNSNAADYAGVLAYLHVEVVPDDQREPDNPNVRHYKVDGIAVFEITMVPKWYFPDKHRGKPWLGAYVAYDRGQCKDCQAQLIKDGYTPGFQPGSEAGTAYTNAYWFSFPKEGLCNNTEEGHFNVPDGVKCTWTYKLKGKIPLDGLTNLHQETGGNYSNVEDYRKAGNVEYSRMGKAPPDSCNTTGGLDFWRNPCEEKWCTQRIQRLLAYDMIGPMNSSNVPEDQHCFKPAPPTPPPTPPPPPPTPAAVTPPDGSGSNNDSLPFIIIGGVALLVVAGVGVFCWHKKKTTAATHGILQNEAEAAYAPPDQTNVHGGNNYTNL